jgi:hypothetical protein
MKTLNLSIAMVGSALLLSACSYTSISPNWGVEGQDGKINATAMEAYRQAFEKPDADLGKSMVTSGVKTQ